MASIYCQELIRNSLYLCESYIGNLLKNREKGDGMPEEMRNDEELRIRLINTYYMEDDKSLLDLLIQNAHPIL
jgi:hypothetical protein